MMGYSPQQVDAMSLWQFAAVVDGFMRAHDPKGAGRMSQSEKDELFALIEERG